MCLITHTNIVVDNFNYGKSNPSIKYIYFLTHFHSDHWTGLTPKWSYGKVYCSPITKKLLLNRFPQVPDVEELELNMTHTIYLNEAKTLSVQVNLFDANHCPGAVMILFRGYMGTILHTGDFRFHISMIEEYEELYPKHLRTPDYAKCSIHVDELILDNTYCDPIFKFPNRDKALCDIIDIIEKNKGKKVYLSIYTLGKEEMLICLAEYFKTLIVVDKRRYHDIITIDYRPELFTPDPDKGWILLSSVDREMEARDVQGGRAITISATGWGNAETYGTADGKKYVVPYSLHSNFEEMETFTRSVHPSFLKCVVNNNKSSTKIHNISRFQSYMGTIMHLKQRGIDMFMKNYTSPNSLSEEYKNCMKLENKEVLELELGLKKIGEENTPIQPKKPFKPQRPKKGTLLHQFNKLKRNKTLGGRANSKDNKKKVSSAASKKVKPELGQDISPKEENKSETRFDENSKPMTEFSTSDEEMEAEEILETILAENLSQKEKTEVQGLTWHPGLEASNNQDTVQLSLQDMAGSHKNEEDFEANELLEIYNQIYRDEIEKDPHSREASQVARGKAEEDSRKSLNFCKGSQESTRNRPFEDKPFETSMSTSNREPYKKEQLLKSFEPSIQKSTQKTNQQGTTTKPFTQEVSSGLGFNPLKRKFEDISSHSSRKNGNHQTKRMSTPSFETTKKVKKTENKTESAADQLDLAKWVFKKKALS